MHLREANLSDLPRLGEIAVAAFTGVSFFEFLYPDHHIHQSDFKTAFSLDIRAHILKPNNVVMVAVDDDDDDRGNARIVAFSVWMFWPEDGSLHTPQILQDPKPNSNLPTIDMAKTSVGKKFARTSTLLSSYLPTWPRSPPRYPNKTQVDAFLSSFSHVITNVWGSKYAVHWHLRFLACDPERQREGAGSMLLRWGQRQAENEGLAVMLEPGNDKAHGFYIRKGFKVLGHFEIGGKTYDEIYWEGEEKGGEGEGREGEGEGEGEGREGEGEGEGERREERGES